MSTRPRRNHSPHIKARVAVALMELPAKPEQLGLDHDFLAGTLTKAGALSATR